MTALPLTAQRVAGMLPPRRLGSAKWHYGRLLCLCGSGQMPGAAVLCTRAASVSGVGLVRLAAPQSVCHIAACHLAECTHLILPQTPAGDPARTALPLLLDAGQAASAWVVGPGLGRSADAAALLAGLLPQIAAPMVIDADGLNLLAEQPQWLDSAAVPRVLTPHMVEFSRLSGLTVEQISQDPAGHAADFAARHGVTLVLKGPDTYVAAPDGRLWLNRLDNSGLAKGGSGDVLAGLIGGLLAQGADAPAAACAAVFLHARAGWLAMQAKTAYGMTPSDVIDRLPEAFAQLL